MRRVWSVAFLAVAIVAATLPALRAEEDKNEKPKFTIKQVMEKANKMGLQKKVVGGSASQAEKDELVELYTALAKGKPEKGDEKSWKDKTENLLKAAKDVAAGKEGATQALAKAANCKGCHSVHK